jgi:hypothetical protein
VESLTAYFTAWKVIRAGSREITDAIVAPEHRGPSPGLAQALEEWDGAYYWPGGGTGHVVLVRPVGEQRPHGWLLHGVLLLITIICTLGAGAYLNGRLTPLNGEGLIDKLGALMMYFVRFGAGSWSQNLSGWSFAFPLLGILLVHELGHYFAARRYAIDTSLPYFLPIPPLLALFPIGTLGAFIRLRSPVLDRRQLMDVGAAGPLAGFVVALGVLIWGYATSSPGEAGLGASATYVQFGPQAYLLLGDSLLTGLLRDHFFPGMASVHLSLPGFAGWVGAFITGLNLLPLSQLDGGHVLYGLIGRWQSTVALAGLAGLVYLAQSSPNWYVWVAFTLLVGGGRWAHPSVLTPSRPILASRRVLGWLCVLVFALTFVPMPFKG